MKALIEKLASKSKEVAFSFDEKIGVREIVELLVDKGIQLLRGLLLIFRGKPPRLIFLGKGLKFKSIHKVDIGRWVTLGDFCFISGLGSGRLTIGDGVSIGSHSRVFVSMNYRDLGEYISIGANVGVGDYSCIAGSGGLDIGDGTITGPYFSVHPENHNFSDVNNEIRGQGTYRKKVVIGKGCWVGAKVTVLAGVTIGDGCVIGAGSVVTKDLPPNCIAVGVPARVVKNRS